MNQYKDTAIVLSRIDFGERDRILSLLAREHGKISVIAKGVRSAKSKLAGGIELFSESQVSVIQGRGSLGTLVSSRLIHHHGGIVQDLERTRLGYSFLQIIQKLVEDETGQEYYEILSLALAKLGDASYDYHLVSLWFTLHVLHLSGRLPKLTVDGGEAFNFNHDTQQFIAAQEGKFTQNDLKVLRLCAAASKPPKLQNHLGSEAQLAGLVTNLLIENL